jgi:hypothetical protein
MPWIDIVSEELPRLRLYASASLGSPARGDLAVETALRWLLDDNISEPPSRLTAFRLLDLEIRRNTRQSDSERVELLKHVAGFDADEARSIVSPQDGTPLRSAG